MSSLFVHPALTQCETISTPLTTEMLGRNALRCEPDHEKLAILGEVIAANPEVGDAGLFVDADLVELRLKQFRALVPDAAPVFDMARLDDPAVVEFVAELGCPLSAASGHHFQLASILGIPGASVRHGYPVLIEDTIEAARELKPPVLAVDGIDGVLRLISKGVLGQEGYTPRIAIHVKSGSQPFVDPAKVKEVVLAAKAYGVIEFEIVGTISSEFHDIRIVRACLDSIRTAAAELHRIPGVSLYGVHVGGGLLDARSLEQLHVSPQQYLSDLGQAISECKAAIVKSGSCPHLGMDIGRWLIGEAAIAAKVTGTRVDQGEFQVFTVEGRYNGLNRSMYDNERIDVGMVPRCGVSSSTDLVDAVVQGGSCDSVDKLGGKHKLPADVKAGDWLAFFSTGSDSISCGLDFNMIESAGVVLYRRKEKELQFNQSPFLRKQEELIREILEWNKDGRVTREYEHYLRNIGSAYVKFREGAKLQEMHLKSLAYLRDIFKGSKNPDEKRLLSTGFLMADGLQVVATIETLLDGLGVDGLCIAQKAQNDPSVVAVEYAVNAYLRARGKNGPDGKNRVMMDTASAGEMKLAKACGFPPAEMIVSHPHKTDTTIALMKEYRPWAFTFDSEQELDRVLEGGAGPVPATETEAAYEPTAMVRIKGQAVGVKNDLSSKFGVDVEEAVRLLAVAKEKGFTKFGVAFHVGTQSCLPSNYGDTLHKGVLEVMKAAKKLGIQISTVDIGGGFPDSRAVRAASLLGIEEALKASIRALVETNWATENPNKGRLHRGLEDTVRSYWAQFAQKHPEFSRSEESRVRLNQLIAQIIKNPWKDVPLHEGESPTIEMTQRRVCKLVYRAIRDALDITQREVIDGVGEHIKRFRADVAQTLGQEVYIVAEPGRVITDRGTIMTPAITVSDESVDGNAGFIRFAEFLRGGLSGQTHDEQSWDMNALAGPHRDKGFAFFHRHSDLETEKTRLMAVYGATGFESDRFRYRGQDYYLPRAFQCGDLVGIHCTGSYSFSAGAIAHGIEPSGVVLAFHDRADISPLFSRNRVYRKALQLIRNEPAEG